MTDFFCGFSATEAESTPSPKSSSVNSSGASLAFLVLYLAFFFLAVELAAEVLALRGAFGFVSSALELLDGIENPEFQIRIYCGCDEAFTAKKDAKCMRELGGTNSH